MVQNLRAAKLLPIDPGILDRGIAEKTRNAR